MHFHCAVVGLEAGMKADVLGRRNLARRLRASISGSGAIGRARLEIDGCVRGLREVEIGITLLGKQQYVTSTI